ncbi:MAG: YaeQ family protein [Acidobacteria bacterium]|nr:YaeQ family protein [Acidobacteriota bacterium]
MALTATIHNFEVELADIDRGVYETLSLRLARQPSETLEYMVTRFLAYCLEYAEGIELTEGVAAGDDPAILVRDLTGRVTSWIEVGMPDAPRVHKGSKFAERVALYTHRDVARVLAELDGKKIHRATDIPVYAFGRGFVDQVAAGLERRVTVSVSVTERQLYLDVNGRTFNTTIAEHHFA